MGAELMMAADRLPLAILLRLRLSCHRLEESLLNQEILCQKVISLIRFHGIPSALCFAMTHSAKLKRSTRSVAAGFDLAPVNPVMGVLVLRGREKLKPGVSITKILLRLTLKHSSSLWRSSKVPIGWVSMRFHLPVTLSQRELRRVLITSYQVPLRCPVMVNWSSMPLSPVPRIPTPRFSGQIAQQLSG